MSLSPPRHSPLMPGYRLDRYELLAPVADGGMGQVWIARLLGKHGFEKLVAIKTLLPKFAGDDSFRQMFLDEASIASRIKNMNVAEILDLGEEREVLFLVMEWVDGESLAKIARVLAKKKIPLPLGMSLRIIADTCLGVHSAHEMCGPDGKNIGVVHRDISPQNILVAANGIVKLIDFGIAKARDRRAEETSQGVLKGKIPYMAPEQALGSALDRRTDIYALGASLYHLISGRPVYESDSQIATLRLLITGVKPPPLSSEIPECVSRIVQKALAHDASKRFDTALDMQRELKKAMTELGLDMEPSDIAAFTTQHMAERIRERREAVELALKAAADRAAMNDLLRPAQVDPSSSSRLIASAPGVLTDPALRAEQATILTPGTGNSALSVADEEVSILVTMDAPKRRPVILIAAVVAAVVGLVAVTWVIASRVERGPNRSATPTEAVPAPAPTGSGAVVASPVESAAPAAQLSASASASASASTPSAVPAPRNPKAPVMAGVAGGTARPAGSAPKGSKSATPKGAKGEDPDFGY